VISNIVLNTYETSKGNDCSRCGEMIRNDNDVWFSGFIKNLGQATAYMTKIW